MMSDEKVQASIFNSIFLSKIDDTAAVEYLNNTVFNKILVLKHVSRFIG